MVSIYKRLISSNALNWVGIPIVLITVLLLISLIFIGRVIERKEKENLRGMLNDNVEYADTLLDSWVENKVSTVELWSNQDGLRRHAAEVLKLKENGGDFAKYHHASTYGDSMDRQVLEHGLLGYFIIAPDGTSLASMRDNNIGTKNIVMLTLPDVFSRVLAGESIVTRPIITDVPIINTRGEMSAKSITSFVMTPIRDDNGTIIAIFSNRISHNSSVASIFEFLHIGSTGESYIFDSRGRMLSESRFKEDLVALGMLGRDEESALNVFLRDPGTLITLETDSHLSLKNKPLTLMARRAIEGGAGSSIEGYRDYRGELVVGAWTWNEKLGVGIAVEIDEAEAFDSLRLTLTYLYSFSFVAIIVLLGAAVVTDWISKRHKKSISELNKEQERTDVILNAAGEGVYGIDAKGFTTFTNPKVTELLGFQAQELIGEKMHDMLHHSRADGSHYPVEECPMSNMIVTGKSITVANEVFWHKKGHSIPVSYTGTPIVEEGKVVGGVITFRDATSELEAIEQIEKSMEEARAANRAKSIFLSSMSHELRTPLNAVMGFGQLLLLDQEKFKKKHVDQINYIISSGEHLLSLINDVLELSKVDAGEMSISLERVSPADVIEESLSMVKSMAQDRHVSINNAWVNKDNLMLKSDFLRAKQCVINLLSNAIKYNHEGGKVVIDTRIVEEGFLRIIITDTGIGIQKNKINDLWEPFNRLGVETGDVEGTGIGLCVTKDILALIGGKIGVESQVGIGSKFWLDLPLWSGDEIPVKPRVKKENINVTLEDVDFGLFADKFIYCVEDNPSNETFLRNIFSEATGVKLVVARTGEEAVAALAKLTPDAILLDLNLPGINGFDVMKSLKKMPHMKNIPIFAVTANIEPILKKKADDAGFNGFLLKPLQVNYLHGLLKKAMGL